MAWGQEQVPRQPAHLEKLRRGLSRPEKLDVLLDGASRGVCEPVSKLFWLACTPHEQQSLDYFSALKALICRRISSAPSWKAVKAEVKHHAITKLHHMAS